MNFLQNHADRAIARHMLTVAALIIGAALVVTVGADLMSAADTLSGTIAAQGNF